MSGLRARMPADVTRPDRLLGPYTARQTVLLAAAAVLLYAGWLTVRGLVPALPAALAGGLLLAGCAAGLLVRVGGRPAEDRAVDLVRFAAASRRRSPAPFRGLRGGPRLGPLTVPVAGVTGDGTLALVDGRRLALVEVGGVSFRLRGEAEQQTLLAGFAGWLNALPAPVQLLVVNEPVSLAAASAGLRARAAGLAHPKLEAAAHAHARFLDGLAAERRMLRRRCLLLAPAEDAGPVVDGLAAAGLTARRLDRAQVLATLAAAGGTPPPAAGAALADPDQLVTTAGAAREGGQS